MLANRSVPSNTSFLHVVYQAAAAFARLSKTSGFIEHSRSDVPASAAQVRYGGTWLMQREPRGGNTPRMRGDGSQSLTVFVEVIGLHQEGSHS